MILITNLNFLVAGFELVKVLSTREQSMNYSKKKSVMLVTANVFFANRIKQALANSEDGFFVEKEYRELRSALAYLSSECSDVVMIDLVLPDARGSEVLHVLAGYFEQVPVVIINSLNRTDIALWAVREGAQDFVTRNEINCERLEHVLSASVSRHQRLLEVKSKIKWVEEERGLLAGMVNHGCFRLKRTQATTPLKTREPDLFEKFLRDYSAVILYSIDETASRLTGNGYEEKISELSEELGNLDATPSDLTALHCDCVKNFSLRSKGRRLAAFNEAARLVLIKLMGSLAYFYRKQIKSDNVTAFHEQQ